MPLDQEDIELTENVPQILEKMERGKFYSFLELHNLLWPGKRPKDNMNALVARYADLITTLRILVSEGKLKTGIKKNLEIEEVKVGDQVYKTEPDLYYGIPRKDSRKH